MAASLLAAPVTPVVAAPGPPPLHQGLLVSGQSPNLCLTGGVVGKVLFTAVCDRSNRFQNLFLSSVGALQVGLNCVQPDSTAEGARIRVAACNAQGGRQNWWFTSALQSGDRRGRCVTQNAVSADGSHGTVRLKNCTGKPNQKWRSQALW
ncbi:ricin-type beta-trefoil lectin domain protein [Actinoplanes flavus]|uniref:RICIN domain-containing protein n=1 Tax=Actinoplanes flavus TaxID=2820290 RepID=A0ABS3UQ98_9ACTN|nr:ricin-type beta-trefoil lectin domain protein [Actinoplanes flavus]MBO3740953.1 RICIN domain-containing protein [Actinoplanes flavus]